MKVNVISNISLGIVSVCFFLLLSSCSSRPIYPEPRRKDNYIIINTGGMKPDAPAFFTFRHLDKNINFFVIKTGNNTLSFLDACMTCYHMKLGYRYENGRIVCRACYMEYTMAKIENGLGGCFPIKIEGKLKGSDYLIPIATLDAAADKF